MPCRTPRGARNPSKPQAPLTRDPSLGLKESIPPGLALRAGLSVVRSAGPQRSRFVASCHVKQRQCRPSGRTWRGECVQVVAKLWRQFHGKVTTCGAWPRSRSLRLVTTAVAGPAGTGHPGRPCTANGDAPGRAWPCTTGPCMGRGAGRRGLRCWSGTTEGPSGEGDLTCNQFHVRDVRRRPAVGEKSTGGSDVSDVVVPAASTAAAASRACRTACAATPQESRASIKTPDPPTSSKIDPVNAVLRPSGTGPLGAARDSPCAPRRRPAGSWRAARLFINRDIAFAYSSGRQSPGARRILLIPMDNRILLVTPRRQPIECRALLAMAAGEVGGGGGVP